MTTRLLLRPTGFVDAPFGHDGQVLRLAGGLCWFSAVEAIAWDGARRTGQTLVPVERLESFLATLGDARAEAERTLVRLTSPRAPLVLGPSHSRRHPGPEPGSRFLSPAAGSGDGVAPRTIRLDQPQAMAILNVTPDSFSDGGTHGGDPAGAAAAGTAMLEAGAALLDVGGESTRPGAATVWEGDEIARVVPVIERLAAAGAAVSIDTRKGAVMAAALDAGAGLVNDVSGLTWDAEALPLIAARGCPVVLMHNKGDPQAMQAQAHYADALVEVYLWLAERVEAAVAAGVDRARILIDPGVGFGKTLRHNLQILNGLSLFHGLGCPIVLGASRKRFIGALSNEAPVERRLGGSVAVALLGAAQGVQLLRVHDAAETVQALRVWRGLRDEALAPG